MSLLKLGGVAVAAVAALLLLVNSSSGFALLGAFALVAFSVWYAEHSTMTHVIPFDRAVLITGCDTGTVERHHLNGLQDFGFSANLRSMESKVDGLAQDYTNT